VIADWLMRHNYVPHGTRAWDVLDRLRGRAA
jgi:hypothetical protein